MTKSVIFYTRLAAKVNHLKLLNFDMQAAQQSAIRASDINIQVLGVQPTEAQCDHEPRQVVC